MSQGEQPASAHASSDSSSAISSPDRSLRLPAKVVVSLRAGVMLAIANVICVIIFSYAWVKVKSEPKVIGVTGSAKKAIQSDLVVWSAKISATSADLPATYRTLSDSRQRTLDYLKSKNIPDSEISVQSVNTWKRRARDEKGNETERVSAYELWQNIQVTSNDVRKVMATSNAITSLIEEGVAIESASPQFIYTKLADLKISMLAEATKDATARATQIAMNSGATLGTISDARMGVMQINPIHSYETSGSGMSDTSSYEKEITAVVSARFSLK